MIGWMKGESWRGSYDHATWFEWCNDDERTIAASGAGREGGPASDADAAGFPLTSESDLVLLVDIFGGGSNGLGIARGRRGRPSRDTESPEFQVAMHLRGLGELWPH
jgi:hypothetical protein